MSLEFNNPFLNMYLEYVEDTESPRLFHIWSALSGISACMGRRVTLPFGISDIFANQYVLLVGPPGVRKSTATKIMQKLVSKNTGVRFAPDDSGGQRQGIIKSMLNEDDNDELAMLEEMDAAAVALNIDKIANVETHIDKRDAHCIYAVASEFNTFIGHNSIDMITFLAKMWDGEDYTYQIKNSKHVLENPLLNLIGGTTPTNISTAMPPEAIGQGFMSRIILVFGNQKYKSVPRPKELDKDLEAQIGNTYSFVFHTFDGHITETERARKLIDGMYEEEVKITDPRFVYYAERRHVHLIKLCMSLAAARRSNQIDITDVEDAALILRTTEQFMPDALGEYGLSPLAAAKQKMVEFLRHAKGPVRTDILWAVMQRDMKQIDFRNSLSDLINAGKIMEVTSKSGKQCFVYKLQKEDPLAGIIEELAEEDAAE